MTDGALIEGLDYTIEGGKWVFTAAYLKKRGTCCESVCRNCPYGFTKGLKTPMNSSVPLSLQEIYSPKSICFGCGPANEKGLKIRSFYNEEKNEFEATFVPEKYQEAFPKVVNGGIIGALLDCHSNWAASFSLMNQNRLSEPPCSVTSEFHVKLKRPTSSLVPLTIVARVVSIEADRATIDAEIISNGKTTATCRGIFVAVKSDHPAYHRW